MGKKRATGTKGRSHPGTPTSTLPGAPAQEGGRGVGRHQRPAPETPSGLEGTYHIQGFTVGCPLNSKGTRFLVTLSSREEQEET